MSSLPTVSLLPLAAFSLALSGCANLRPPPTHPMPNGELISVENQPGPFCGRCDSVKVTVLSNGRVWTEHGYWAGRYTDWTIERRLRRVSLATFLRFADRLRPFRPHGQLSLNEQPQCARLASDFDGAQVQWRDRAGSDKLILDFSCDPQVRQAMAVAIRDAPELLGFRGLRMPWGQWVARTAR